MATNTKAQPSGDLPDSLKSTFQKVDDKLLAKSRENMNQENRENSKILEKLNEDSFVLSKDLLLLAGTIFGSSIALAAGRSVNTLFIIGELFNFVSIVSGLIILVTHLKAKEWDYAFLSKNSLELFLVLNRNKVEKFELETIEGLIESYKKIMKTNQAGFFYRLLKLVSIEKWPLVFYVTFLVGILLILISIVPSELITDIMNVVPCLHSC